MPIKPHSNNFYNFSEHLFWDVPKANVNLNKHSQFIVKRVLEYGLIDDWNFIKSYYGIEKIVELVKKMRELEPKALSYIATISKTPREEFRCYNLRQSNKAHLNF